MADQTQVQTQAPAEKSAARELMDRWKYRPGSRESVTRTFDKLTGSISGSDRKDLKRISQAPVSASEKGIGDVLAQKAQIELDLADLADEYCKLDVRFRDLIGKNAQYGFKDAMAMAFYTVTMQRQKVKGIKIEAVRAKGNALEFLIDRMAEVVDEKHEKAKEGKSYAEALQIENISLMKRLDKDLIDRLRMGYVGTFDDATVRKELGSLEKELLEIDGTLEELEGKAQAAKAVADLDGLKRYTDEMGQILEMKYEVLDGRRCKEGEVSEARRKMLDSAEGVQSAKGAIAASKVNYRAITGLIDAMAELEIKYRYAKSDMIPVFKIQAKIADKSEEALKMKDALMRLSETSRNLMELNEKLVVRLTTEVFDLLQQPTYDVAKCNEVEQRLFGYQQQLNQAKVEWANNQQLVAGMKETPHYIQAE